MTVPQLAKHIGAIHAMLNSAWWGWDLNPGPTVLLDLSVVRGQLFNQSKTNTSVKDLKNELLEK